MPRVYTQVAAKDYPEHGIKKGDTYYKWKFRYGGVRKSKTPPTRSQLTQSEFYGTIYTIEDDTLANIANADDLHSVIEELENLRDEQEEKRYNMPDHLQDVGTGEMLQNRYDYLDEMINELEPIADEMEALEEEIAELEGESPEDGSDEAEELEQKRQELEDKLDEARDISYQGD